MLPHNKSETLKENGSSPLVALCRSLISALSRKTPEPTKKECQLFAENTNFLTKHEKGEKAELNRAKILLFSKLESIFSNQEVCDRVMEIGFINNPGGQKKKLLELIEDIEKQLGSHVACRKNLVLNQIISLIESFNNQT